MEEELQQLREALQRETRRREEETRRREEETRRRKEAEQALQPLSLPGYLEAFHSASLALTVVTDPRSTTKGTPANPEGRIYPRRIVPWTEFPARQEEIWALVADDSVATRSFPSQHQVDFVRSMINPVSSEQGLRHFAYNTVENAVQRLVEAVHSSSVLRDRLGLRGTVTFESHTNFPPPAVDVSQEGVEGGAGAPPATPAAQRPRRRQPIDTGSRGNMADQFCIYTTADNNTQVPAAAIEYKPPHKLSQAEVVTGFEAEIQPARDIINTEGTGFVFAARTLVAAVVTQLFSYMIGKSIQYGYIYTGETLVFLHIPDDPTMVLYHVCVPNVDVVEGDEGRLHRTAVAQVFAFVLQSVRATPPPSSWHDTARTLDKWEVVYDDILSKIPPSVRQDKEKHTPYKPQKWKGVLRSPIRTRASCKPDTAARNDQSDNNDDSNNGGDSALPPTPSRTGPPNRSTNRAQAAGAGNEGAQQGSNRGQKKKAATTAAHISIQDRPYCTHACLFGLSSGGALDQTCPNVAQHGAAHMEHELFLRLLRHQLGTDRGADADAAPLYMAGSIGSLFKVRLSATGYTMVAKGVSTANRTFLQDERDVYSVLRAVQGQYVPVCVGLLDLILPHYCDGGVFSHFLLLSWAGQSLSVCFAQVDKTFATAAIAAAFREIHRLHVLHGDAEPRNVLFDKASGRIMVADFERSTVCAPTVLAPLSPNSKRKRERLQASQESKPSKKGDEGRLEDAFTKELESAVRHASWLFKP